MNVVIAGSAIQYEEWLRGNNLNPKEYKYITKVNQLQGIRPTAIHRIGTFWDTSQDIRDFVSYLENQVKPR